MQPIERKAELRVILSRRRLIIGESEQKAANEAIAVRLSALIAAQAPRTVFAYVATAAEVATRPIIDVLVEDAVEVLVPKIVNRTEMRAVRFSSWDSMVAGPMGILAPESDVAHEGEIDIAIVPGLGFSLRGDRLGFGAGYYDRWFAQHTGLVRVGIAFDFQLIDEIPRADHDVPMDFLVTDKRLLEISSP